jgi:carotenoid cleavage dioxygenase
VATENYAIFFACPLVAKLENMMAGKPYFIWEPQRGTRIGVMSRNRGDVKWFEKEPFFCRIS